MEKRMLLVGEPLVLMMAKDHGDFSSIFSYDLDIAGAEFNVAVGMKRLGHNISYMTKLGDDPFGDVLIKLIESRGIDTSQIQRSEDNPTGMMIKSFSKVGDPEIYYYRANSAASTLNITDIAKIAISQYTHLHLTGILPALSETTKSAVFSLLIEAHKHGLTISFDPNLRKQLWKNKEEMVIIINNLASLCDIFLPGIKEGQKLTGLDSPEEIAQFYLELGAKIVVVKLGEKGCYLANSDGGFYVSGYKVSEIIDTVGAGDGFATGFVSAVMEGLSLKDCAKRANAIGAIQLMSRGDNSGLPSREELERFMAED